MMRPSIYGENLFDDFFEDDFFWDDRDPDESDGVYSFFAASEVLRSKNLSA